MRMVYVVTVFSSVNAIPAVFSTSAKQEAYFKLLLTSRNVCSDEIDDAIEDEMWVSEDGSERILMDVTLIDKYCE